MAKTKKASGGGFSGIAAQLTPSQAAFLAAHAPTAGNVPQAAAPGGPSAPAAPPRVDPFFTADDLQAINAFTTDLQTKLTGIDTNLQNAETDTAYQKTQNDTSAKTAAGAAQDDAAARGIFTSSIKDANLYDIEAQRSLAAKFLDDKLTTARLDAGTNKQTLATSKTNFDTAMAGKSVENAQGVNDTNSSSWAAAQAAWQAANPTAATPTGPAPAAPSYKAPPAQKTPAAAAKANQTQNDASVANANARNQHAAAQAMARKKTFYG